MSDSLLEKTAQGDDTLQENVGRTPDPAGHPCPENVPDKFWDRDCGEVRTDALLKSYTELERKLGSSPPRCAPPVPEDYEIHIENDLLESDQDVNARLHSAGFTQEQAQLVYDLAAEKLAPMVAEVASMFEAESQIEKLTHNFGGEKRWREAARQIAAWGRSSLPGEVFDALSSTCEGITAMHHMMVAGEPGLMRESATPGDALSESDLKQMMRDPRYWKEQDPAFVQKVRDGFRHLYPD